MTVPESLRADGLVPFWVSVRRQIDRGRGRRPNSIRRPSLDTASERALRSLLGDAFRSRIALDALERELVVRGIGRDLDDALAELGHPPSPEADVRRLETTRRREARATFEAAVEGWDAPWAGEWAAGIVASGNLGGLDPDEVAALAGDVGEVVQLVTSTQVALARVDAAALLFGDAHALDPGLRRTTWVARALRHVVGDLEGRELWTAAGLVPDRVSAPALVWNLEAGGDAPAVDLLVAARRRRVPVHLSLLALHGGLCVAPGTVVLVAENPRVVEYAAERGVGHAAVAANGNPSSAVVALVDQLVASAADVRYHGDFDRAGLAICARMAERGCRPWKMTAADYRAALARAADAGVRLDRDERPGGDTPWDPELAVAFDHERLVVHEEFVLDTLFDR